MTDDTHKKLVTQLGRQTNPLADLERALGGNNALSRLAEDMDRQKKLLSAAYGSMEELRRSGALAALTEQGGTIAKWQNELALATERFKLPELSLAVELMETYRTNHVSELVKHLRA